MFDAGAVSAASDAMFDASWSGVFQPGSAAADGYADALAGAVSAARGALAAGVAGLARGDADAVDAVASALSLGVLAPAAGPAPDAALDALAAAGFSDDAGGAVDVLDALVAGVLAPGPAVDAAALVLLSGSGSVEERMI